MHESRQCTAHTSAGNRCKRAAILGGTICSKHGGSASHVKAAAARRVEAQEVQERMVTLGLPRDVDPTTALLEEVQVTAGHVAWLRGEVQRLSPEQLTWGTAQVETGTRPEGPVDVTTKKAQAPVIYDLYLRERKHLAEVSALALRAGVQERQIKLAEQQAVMLAGAVTRTLAGLGLTTAQHDLARELMSRELRQLAAIEGEAA